jgi:hypothetical protein
VEHSRHVHGKQMDNTLAIERLEDIATDERVINTRIFVVAQIWQHMLPNVDHFREAVDSLSSSWPSDVLCMPHRVPENKSSPLSCTACL